MYAAFLPPVHRFQGKFSDPLGFPIKAPLYAILSGFAFGDTPGDGTFYDYLDKLWNSESDNLSPHETPVKNKKIRKPNQK